MARYTSILLPLAKSRMRRLEEAAEARGETLESFILEAAEAEAERLGQRLADRGHSVDHQIYTSSTRKFRPPAAELAHGEHQIDVGRVAMELGWHDEHSEEWLDDVDRLIAGLETWDDLRTGPAFKAPSSHDARRSPRREVRRVQVLNPVKGMVVDMSETGLGVETHGPFSVPEQIYLSIGRAVASAKIRAEVRWCVLVRTERFINGDVIPIYRSGLAFVGQ